MIEQATQADRAEIGEQLLAVVYDELRTIASRLLRHERPEHTLQPTALVNEAYLRMAAQAGAVWDCRGEFCAAAARLMRQVLVDHARRRDAAKRGGTWQKCGWDMTLTIEEETGPHALDVLALHEALLRLHELNERHARVVEMRFFGGMSVAEVGAVLRVSEETIKKDWHVARAWMASELDRT